MEQLELELYSKRHPRSVFYTACLSLQIPVPVDYILDGSDLDRRVPEKNKKTYLEFVSFLKSPEKVTKTSVKIRSAFDLYSDYDTRIFLEALLLNHPISEVSKVFKVDSSVLKYYESIFFDWSDFRSNPASFLRFININEVADWFILCKSKSVKEIMYAVRNESSKELIDMAQGLKEMFDEGIKDWKTYHKLKPQSILAGITKEDVEGYKIAEAGAKVAQNAAKIYYQFYDIIHKSEKSFAEQWKFILFGDNASKYKDGQVIIEEVTTGEKAATIKEALGDQLQQLQPKIEEPKKKPSE